MRSFCSLLMVGGLINYQRAALWLRMYSSLTDKHGVNKFKFMGAEISMTHVLDS